MAETHMAEIKSPCVQICSLDPAGDLCLGCGRTLAEITAWQQLDPMERQRIMAGLPARIRVLRAQYAARRHAADADVM